MALSIRTFAVFLLVLSTAAAPALAGKKSIADRVKFVDDEFNGVLMYTGPRLSFRSEDFLSPTRADSRLRTVQDPDNPAAMIHQIYLTLNYRDSKGRYFDSANFAGGIKAEVTHMAYDRVNCLKSAGQRMCIYNETVGVTMSDRFLRANLQTGVRAKLWSRDGHTIVVELPPDFIAGQLEAIARRQN